MTLRANERAREKTHASSDFSVWVCACKSPVRPPMANEARAAATAPLWVTERPRSAPNQIAPAASFPPAQCDAAVWHFCKCRRRFSIASMCFCARREIALSLFSRLDECLPLLSISYDCARFFCVSIFTVYTSFVLVFSLQCTKACGRGRDEFRYEAIGRIISSRGVCRSDRPD